MSKVGARLLNSDPYDTCNNQCWTHQQAYEKNDETCIDHEFNRRIPSIISQLFKERDRNIMPKIRHAKLDSSYNQIT